MLPYHRHNYPSTLPASLHGPGSHDTAAVYPASLISPNPLHVHQTPTTQPPGTSMSVSDVQELRRKIPRWQSFSLDFVLGGVIGGVSHTIVAPIERVKLILQTQDINVAMLGGHHRKYRGFLDTVSTIVREEGVWALWRGNGTGVLRYYPSVALNFAFKVRPCMLCQMLLRRPVQFRKMFSSITSAWLKAHTMMMKTGKERILIASPGYHEGNHSRRLHAIPMPNRTPPPF